MNLMPQAFRPVRDDFHLRLAFQIASFERDIRARSMASSAS